MMAKHTVAVLLAAGLAGCAAAPDFQRPAAPAATHYTAQALDSPTVSAPTDDGAPQRMVAGQDVPERWWTLFGSSALDGLVEDALRANPDLQAAEAALRGARETAAAARGGLAPTVDASLSPTRQRVADVLSSPTASGENLYTLHTAQLSVGYMPDVFGGIHRQIEAAAAQSEVARFQRQAAWLTLTANVVAAAIQEASLRAQLDAMRRQVDSAARLLGMVRQQQRAGQLGAADVAAQESALAQMEATLPPLEKQLAQQRDLLAVLTGRLPSDPVAQSFDFSALKLPLDLPISLPARLVDQRPDVRAAEAQLHAASAQVGVARAARLPNIALSASLGSSAVGLGTLFKSGTGFWSIGADLVQPIFHGGSLMHQQHAAEAAYDQAAAQYRATVLAAFQNVADTLYAIDADAKVLRAAANAERAAGASLAIAQRQRALGAIGFPAVLQPEQAYQQALGSLVQARAARYADTVALFQALGGGWSGDANSSVR